MRRVFSTACLGTAILLATSAAAQGQQVPPQAEEDATQVDGGTGPVILSPVTVTAQKQSQDIIDVPISLSVFDDQTIKDAEIEDITDLTQRTPSFFQQKTGGRGHTTTLNMRGVTSANADFASPTVGVFVDGVSIGGGYDLDFFDVERVEILRGPQGTLYGSNTLGGAVNIISKRPEFRWSGEADLMVARFDTFQERAALGGPVNDKVAFRLTGTKLDSDGYITNTVRNEPGETRDDYSLRGQLLLEPNDRWSINLNLNGLEYDGRFASYAPVDQISGDHFKVTANEPGRAEQSAFGQILNASYSSDKFNVTSITGHRIWRSSELLDVDYTADDLAIDHSRKRNEQYTQELRISSPDDASERFRRLFGGYLAHEDQLTGDDFTINPPLFGVVEPTTSSGEVDVEVQNHAVFGQATHGITERLLVTGGLRYDNVTKTLEAKSATITPTATTAGPRLTGKRDFDALLPKLATEYRWTPNINTYATVSRGYKPGGFQNFNFANADVSYNSEFSWNYEAGVKADLFDDRLRLNAAVFYIDIEDQQFATLVRPNVTALSNIGKSHSQGFEIEATAVPVAGWEIFGSLGMTDAKVDELDAGTSGTRVGARPPHVPRYTATVGSQYRFVSGAYIRAENNFVGSYYLDGNNRLEQDGFSLFSVKVGYEFENFDLYAYGSNLFNEKYLTRAFGGTLPGQGFVAREGEPLSVGMVLRAHF